MDVKSKKKKNFHNIFSLVKNIWSIVNVPNVLTFVRIILIIPFSLEIMNENYSIYNSSHLKRNSYVTCWNVHDKKV